MTKTRAWLLIGIVLLVSAYMAGYWPERQRAQNARDEVATLETRVTELEARVRMGELLGLLLRLSDAVVARNYGEASDQATVYFDRVATERDNAPQSEAQAVLASIHQSRDRVVAALARSEPMILETLREQEHALRRALGYPVPDKIPGLAPVVPSGGQVPGEIPPAGSDVR